MIEQKSLEDFRYSWENADRPIIGFNRTFIFLWTGVMSAHFKLAGNVQWLIEKLISKWSLQTNKSRLFLIILSGILTLGLDNLFFSLKISLYTLLLLISEKTKSPFLQKISLIFNILGWNLYLSIAISMGSDSVMMSFIIALFGSTVRTFTALLKKVLNTSETSLAL